MQELAEVEHKLLSAEVIVAVEGVDAELAPGPNWEVAAMRVPVHDERLVSLSSPLRNDSHPELIPVGIRGFAVEVPVAVDDAYKTKKQKVRCISTKTWAIHTDDWAKATVVRAERIAMDFI